LQVYNESKVRTGVVGHPVSEKGERGVSPSPVSSGSAIVTELACLSQEDCAGEIK